MPIFDYLCRSCNQTFEYLTREAQEPGCPACQSTDVVKQISAWSVGAQKLNAAQKEKQGLIESGFYPVKGTVHKTR